jgi:hypothetical protein
VWKNKLVKMLGAGGRGLKVVDQGIDWDKK